MGRAVRDHRLENRAARSKLVARAEPYWRLINEGAHLGYYRGARLGKWVARYRKAGATGGYRKTTLGEADDFADADGERILDYKQALQLAQTWCDEQARGGTRRGPYTVSDALDEYLEGFEGKSVVDTKSRVEATIRPVLGRYEVADLTKGIIQAFRNERAKSPARLRTKSGSAQNTRPADTAEAQRRRKSTVNRDMSVLKAALNRAAENHPGLPVSAWREVKPYKNVDLAKRRYLSDDECRRLINHLEDPFRPIAKGALLTGGRYGELRHAQVKDYDRAAKVLWLAETKNSKPRPAYLDDEGVQLLDTATAGKAPDALIFSRPDGGMWGKSQQRRRMEDAYVSASIPETSFHDLRRTYGARLARRGVPMAVIAEAMGHADERITRKHYAHLAPNYVADKVREGISGMGIEAKSNLVRFG